MNGDEESADFSNVAPPRVVDSAETVRTAHNNDGATGDRETYSIIGASMEVHSRLGSGFLEAVYQEALAIEFAYRRTSFEREVAIPIRYRDRLLACHNRADFICFRSVVVEIKALPHITNIDRSQVLNYLKATGTERGLILNFGALSLQHQRLAGFCTPEVSVRTES